MVEKNKLGGRGGEKCFSAFGGEMCVYGGGRGG